MWFLSKDQVPEHQSVSRKFVHGRLLVTVHSYCIAKKKLYAFHGRRIVSWVLVGLNLVSWIFSVVTVASCTFVKLIAVEVDDHYAGREEDLYPTSYGLFAANVDGTCQSYNAGKWTKHMTHIEIGRIFGILQNLSLVFVMIGILLVILCLKGIAARWTWLVTKILYCLDIASTFLVFVAFGDCYALVDYTDTASSMYDDLYCTTGAAATMNILNVFILIGMVSVCWFVPLPAASLFRCCGGDNSSPLPTATHTKNGNSNAAAPEQPTPLNEGTVVSRTVENTPQGRKIVEEVTHADGSKTIMETMEQTEEEDDTLTEEEEEDARPPWPPQTQAAVVKARVSMSSSNAGQPIMMKNPKQTAVDVAHDIPVYCSEMEVLPTYMSPPPPIINHRTSYSSRPAPTYTHPSSRFADPPGEAESSSSRIIEASSSS
jgi:hypothetical protein